MAKLSFTMSHNGDGGSSISINFSDRTVTISENHRNFKAASAILQAGKLGPDAEATLRNLVDLPRAIERWSKGAFEIDSERRVVKYAGEQLPTEFQNKILTLLAADNDNWVAFANFYARLQKNPSFRARQQAWKFLAAKGLPIDKEGFFYAYKGVKRNFKDAHSGLFDNSPGRVHYMDPGKVSDDPAITCHVGFHSGTFTYAKGYGDKLIITRVDPAHIRCVPKDTSEKLRHNAYAIVGEATSRRFACEVWEPKSDDYCNNYVKPKGLPSYAVQLTSEAGLPSHAEKLAKLGEVLKFPVELVSVLFREALQSKDRILVQGLGCAQDAKLIRDLVGGVVLERFQDELPEIRPVEAEEQTSSKEQQQPTPAAAAAASADEVTSKPESETSPRPMTRDDLRAKAKEHGLAGYSKLSAKQLRAWWDSFEAKPDSEESTPATNPTKEVAAPDSKAPRPATKSDSMDLKSLRQAVRSFAIPGTGKLGAGHLRTLLAILEQRKAVRDDFLFPDISGEGAEKRRYEKLIQTIKDKQ